MMMGGKRTRESITRKRLRALLFYDPRTGHFYWRVDRSRTVRAGDLAGCLDTSTGYWTIKIDQRKYGAHRLAWLYARGKLPPGIDHRNRRRTDNRLRNLRAATTTENNQNKSLCRRNRARLKGATYDDGAVRRQKWRARIRVNGKTKELGRFKTAREAHDAYKAAARKHFGRFSHA